MKINKIYSNKPEIFPAIEFHDGLNVIFGQVRDYKEKDKDVHNLGKTFLITIIDFCLLVGIDNRHPFKINESAFKDFVFFIEIYDENKRITIRRSTERHTKVSIYTGTLSYQYLTQLDDELWTYRDILLRDAVEIVDSIVKIYPLHPRYNYRKALSYVMRRQTDYGEVFKTSPFSHSPDSDWKLFLALILGFDYEDFAEKYRLNSLIDERETYAKSLKKALPKNANYDEIKTIIDLKSREIHGMVSIVDSYEFESLDREIVFETVQDIDAEISLLNSEIYKLRYENKEMADSIERDIPFNFDDVRDLFNEVRLYMPEALVKDYHEVEEFNRIIFQDRKLRMQDTITKNNATIGIMQSKLSKLSDQRSENILILRDSDIFSKHKRYSEVLRKKEEELSGLKITLSEIERVTLAEGEIRNLKSSLNTVINRLQESIKYPSKTYESIKKSFEQNIKEILSVDAILTVDINKNGNPDPDAKILDAKFMKETNESRGTTYKKMLCVAFDLALAEEYASSGYYKFIYHDGVLEGLDNRRKVSYLNLIRRKCEELDLQYIMTVIDSDVPRDDSDGKKMFSGHEIVRSLNDQGDEGRLFKMPPF